MTDQGIKLDRSIEYWPAKIDQVVSRISTHLGIQSPEGKTEAVTTSDPVNRFPVNLTTISAVAGIVAAIAAVIALYPVFNNSTAENNGNRTLIEGDSVAGNKIVNNNRDERDVALIASLQATIDKLVRWALILLMLQNPLTQKVFRLSLSGLMSHFFP